MARRRKKTGQRAFCATNGPVTREHFVPKGLWPGPRPRFTCTVPTCADCNAGASDDDAYFRNVLASQAAGSSEDAQRPVQGRVLRSLQKDKKRAREVTCGLELRDRTTPNGIWIGRYPSFVVKASRLDRILCKIVLGLHYVARKKPLPPTHGVYIASSGDAAMLELVEGMLPGMTPELGFGTGDDVFLWRFNGDASDVHLTWWLLIFYRDVVFAGATLPLPISDRDTSEPADKNPGAHDAKVQTHGANL